MAELVARIADRRDRDAFARLFHHYGPKLKSFMMRRGADAEAAEDMVQEAMIAVWNKAGQYAPGRGSVTTWIYTIARNLHIDRMRRQSPFHFTDIARYDMPDGEPGGDERVISRERDARVTDALRALPDEQGEVIRLAYLDDLTQSAIAERLGLPLGTVKSRMRLAYHRLREALEESR